MRRRKNPHPKRAVNARTVLKGEKEEPVLCLKIPDEDEVVFENEQKEIQKKKRLLIKKDVIETESQPRA